MGLPRYGAFYGITILLLWSVCSIHSKSKHITVNLEAKWSETPIILETSEFLATESNDNFWRFVDSLADLTKSGAMFNHHDEERYMLSLKLAERLISPLQLNLLKFALSLRTHSPAIQMYDQMALEKKPPSECMTFVEINNMITCEEGAMRAFLNLAASEPKPTLVKSDHVYPGGENQDVVVILYTEVGTKAFQEWHTVLKELADNGKITYVLRHFIKERPKKQLRLSGYGVELAIKSTEYKAKDDTKVTGTNSEQMDDPDDEVQGFLFSKLNDLHPDLKDNLKEFRQHLVDSTNDLAPLKVWQLQDLSFQAAQRVFSATPGDQLRTLRDISQNFPTMARSLVKTQVADTLRNEIQRNQEEFMNNFGLSPGDSAMFINGLQADLDIYDVFTLLDSLKSEAKLMEGLYDLGKQYDVKGPEMMALLNLDLRDTDSNYAVDVRDESVVYLNNLEKDSRYRSWPASVQDLLRPTFPGMLRHIRKNLHHVVFAVDPADKKHKDLLKMAEAFLVHNAPVRLGVLFVVNPDPEVDGTKDAGVAMLRAFNYIKKHENTQKALSFITDIYEQVRDNAITPEFVMQQFLDETEVSPNFMVDEEDSIYDENRSVHNKAQADITPAFVRELFEEKGLDVDEEEVFEQDKYNSGQQGASEFFEKTGLGELPQVLVNGIPMKKFELEPDEFEEAVVSSILKQTNLLQTAVFNNQINDRTDLLEYVMTRNNVMPRLNSRILSSSDLHLDLTAEMPPSAAEKADTFSALNPAKKTAAILAGIKYLTRKEQESFAVTTLVVGDLTTPEGRALMYAALKHLKHSTESRIGIIHNPTTLSSPDSREDDFIPVAVQAAMATLDVSMAKSFITKLMKEENVKALKNGEKTLDDLAVHNMDMVLYEKTRAKQSTEFLRIHQTFVNKVLQFEPGQRGVLTNGKVLGPLKPEEDFIQEDFDLLDKYISRVSGAKIQKKVHNMGLSSEKASDLIMRAAALLTSISQKESRKDVPFYSDVSSVVKLPPGEEQEPAYQVVAILDPTTRAAQKYTPVLMVLQEVANVNIKVFFNCREKLSEMPLKSFYRYVLEPELGFAVDSNLASGPEARFVNMPDSPLLTMGMDPPESWLVESVRTPYDLDNIHLTELDSGIVANYELENLLLEGHCYDSVSSQPPRGLQFILGTNSTHDMVDTIVMANLGYFQLKATPGVWNLRLRPGRSEDIYQITSHELTDSPADSPDVIAVMDSFKTKIIKIKVSKQSGKEREELLTEEEPSKGLWDSISSSLTGGGAGTAADASDDDTINIFSLASGHLYERLMRIMMLSVLKHTKSKVKFWFLKNYLSPTFKDFIPHMAKEYNFEYQLVQYKWPRWLHQQSEKQRIIWGYKILFLDVLFPLNLNKFIFVDADQIVRADLKELVDLDLEGAPYGYTPFCDSRKEMDGFRFWKSGYWASHLAGRKYHISALYVVDLKKFRKIAAGDRLRGQYQGLSQDPNSLSNLDQDLPNNMIHQVNIKTLPQEWLYCDTWCHESELSRAKTIDLCNNPLTKEPKLSAAMRLVPEWKDYDGEVKQLWDSIYNTGTASDSNSDSSSNTGKKPSNDKIEL